MYVNVLCTLILTMLLLIVKASPESPGCERRPVCGSDGQVYETSCDFERALRLDQSLGTLPLHECLGTLYVLKPKEHARALKSFTKPDITRFEVLKLARRVQETHNNKSRNSNAVLELLKDILSLQGREGSVILRSLCPSGQECPDTINILPEKLILPQKNLKSILVPTRKFFNLLEWIPGYTVGKDIKDGILNYIIDYFKELMYKLISYIILKAQEYAISIIKSHILGPLEESYNNKINPDNTNDNSNYNNYVNPNNPNFDYNQYLHNNFYYNNGHVLK